MGKLKERAELLSAVPRQLAAAAAHMLFDAPAVSRLRAAARAINEEFKAPACIERAVAHCGFPNRKVAIYLYRAGTSNGRRAEMQRATWAAAGWKLYVLRHDMIESFAPVELVEEVKDLVGKKASK